MAPTWNFFNSIEQWKLSFNISCLKMAGRFVSKEPKCICTKLMSRRLKMVTKFWLDKRARVLRSTRSSSAPKFSDFVRTITWFTKIVRCIWSSDSELGDASHGAALKVPKTWPRPLIRRVLSKWLMPDLLSSLSNGAPKFEEFEFFWKFSTKVLRNSRIFYISHRLLSGLILRARSLEHGSERFSGRGDIFKAGLDRRYCSVAQRAIYEQTPKNLRGTRTIQKKESLEEH